jgi:predicted SprT family Zn-dependent metalloprotease
MKLEEANRMALELMGQHGLLTKGWQFMFDNAHKRFGCCRFTQKCISVSRHLAAINEAWIVRDTILHEIAHALAGFKHGHDDVWKRVATQIGCRPERCYSNDVVVTTAKYHAHCPACNQLYRRFKRPRFIQSCGRCSGTQFNYRYELHWIKVRED